MGVMKWNFDIQRGVAWSTGWWESMSGEAMRLGICDH